MYRYAKFDEYNVLLIVFSGDFVGAEGDRAFWEILNNEGVEWAATLKCMILDLRNVKSMSLADSDKARVLFFEKALKEVFDQGEVDFEAFVSSASAYAIEALDADIAAIYKERLERLSSPLRQTSSIPVYPTLSSVLDKIGLTHELARFENACRTLI